jgi:hypothetical protein
VYSVEISRFPEEESEEDFKPFILGVVNTRSRQIIQPFATGRNISFVLEKEALLTRMFFLHPKTGLFSVNRKEKEALIHHNFSAAETGNKNTTTETVSNNKSSLTVSLLEDGVVVDRARIEVTFAAASNQQKQKQQREEGHHPMSGKSNDDNTILHAFEFEQVFFCIYCKKKII